MRSHRAAALGVVLAVGVAVAVALAPPARAAEGPPSSAPDGAGTGEVRTWKSADGLAYEYFVPKHYDAAKGANLTFILHGSNLDRRWGFANHAAGEFRPDDIVVSPDGTTPNASGTGFNSMQSGKDLARLRKLHDELKKAFNVRATYVYGHSQGAFFACLYAGAYPDDVNGVLAQAGGVWRGTQGSAKHHHQAIVLMHGTADPVVGYGNSAGCMSFYTDLEYPLARLRPLEGWNHWPNAYAAAQELAWCEGMTSKDPERVAAAFAELDKVQDDNGWGRDARALYDVATRCAAMEGVAPDVKTRAAERAASVDAVAKTHAAEIAKGTPKGKATKLEDAPWVGHLFAFARDFRGVPACDALCAEWGKTLEQHEKAARKSLDDYWQAREKDPAKAFAAGVDAVKVAFLSWQVQDPQFLEQLAAWRADAAKLKLTKGALAAYDANVVALVSARKKGLESYAELNRKM